MKIEANITNVFKCFNEARRIAKNKKRIIKTEKLSLKTYWVSKLIILGSYLFLALLLIFNGCIMGANIIIFLIIIYWLGSFFRVIISFKMRKKALVLVFNKEGITDESYLGIKMVFKWEKIQAVVFGTYSITILTDTPYYLFLGIKAKNKVVDALNKYNKEVLVIGL